MEARRIIQSEQAIRSWWNKDGNYNDELMIRVREAKRNLTQIQIHND